MTTCTSTTAITRSALGVTCKCCRNHSIESIRAGYVTGESGASKMSLQHLGVSCICNVMEFKFDMADARKDLGRCVQQNIPFGSLAIHLEIVHAVEAVFIQEAF